jgi:hypothetical protein
MDFLRFLLNRTVFVTIQGMTFPTWARLLRRNGFRVHPLYWPRAVLLTATSLANTAFAALDLLLFGRWVRRARVEAPLIIVGHYRSGTTHLHNLLSLDGRFAYPTLFQTLNPDSFLVTEWLFGLLSELVLMSHRPQDRVPIDPDVPAEEEVAVAVSSLSSPYIGWVFPGRREEYDRYLTLRDVPEAEVRRWKESLLWFLKKLTLRYGRPLILKSPPHTARIRLLLELFPDARFVHIRRNPYEVFQSTRRLLTKLPPYFAMQWDGRRGLDDRILEGYRRMYDAYFEERGLIPEGRLAEVSYEALERDPMGTVEGIYRTLGLPDFDRVRPDLGRYLASVASYRKNAHPDLPDDLRLRIAREWRRCFEAWGYPTDVPRGPHAVAGRHPRRRAANEA